MEEKLHEALAELEKNLSNLKSYIEYIEQAKENSKKISEAAEEVVEKLKNVQEEYGKLKSAVDKLMEKIDKVDFPQRLDKLDVTVSTINQNISNLQNRVEKIYSDIDLKIDRSTNSIITTLNEAYNELNHKLSSLTQFVNYISRQNKFIKIFSIGSTLFIIILLILIIYKMFFIP